MSEFKFEDLPPPMGDNHPPEDMDEEIDFSADEHLAVSETQLSRVSALSKEYTELKEDITVAKGALEQLEKRYDQIRFMELPDAMAAANMDMIQSNGMKISVGAFVRASLMKDPETRKKAAEWLRSVGRGALIKRKVGVMLGVGNDEAASKVAAILEKEIPGSVVVDELDVHHSTLSSAIKAMMEDGEPVPTTGEEIGINLFSGREAKISKSRR